MDADFKAEIAAQREKVANDAFQPTPWADYPGVTAANKPSQADIDKYAPYMRRIKNRLFFSINEIDREAQEAMNGKDTIKRIKRTFLKSKTIFSS